MMTRSLSPKQAPRQPTPAELDALERKFLALEADANRERVIATHNAERAYDSYGEGGALHDIDGANETLSGYIAHLVQIEAHAAHVKQELSGVREFVARQRRLLRTRPLRRFFVPRTVRRASSSHTRAPRVQRRAARKVVATSAGSGDGPAPPRTRLAYVGASAVVEASIGMWGWARATLARWGGAS